MVLNRSALLSLETEPNGFNERPIYVESVPVAERRMGRFFVLPLSLYVRSAGQRFAFARNLPPAAGERSLLSVNSKQLDTI